MLYINDKAKEILKQLNTDNIYIMSDFDKTITEATSDSSWEILSINKAVPEEYEIERENLYNQYRPFEIDDDLDYQTKCQKMCEWWRKHISLLIKYRISEQTIDNVANNEDSMRLRNGAKTFLATLSQKRVPVVIISAGVGNFIEAFLKNKDCYYDNIFILSNFVKFENGVAAGLEEKIIHSWNKNNAPLPEEAKELVDNRKYILVFGDIIGDTNMAKDDDYHETLKIGFYNDGTEESFDEFKEAFDIVCAHESSYSDIANLLNL